MSEPEAEVPTSSKKRRIAEATIPFLCRSAQFWFEDGTIILQAEELQFRVHRGVLSANSTFFADMLKLPQPQNEPLVDGCSLVHVHETVQEWQDMLTMLYDPLGTQKLLGTLPFAFLRALLRLGTKYQFDGIRDWALVHFKSRFPDRKFVSESWPQLHTWGAKYMIDSLNLAVELGIQTVLPVLYYACCDTLDMVEIMDGCVRQDKTILRLSGEAQRSLLLGRDRLRSTIILDLCGWISQTDTAPFPGCTDRRKCRHMVNGLRKEILTMSIGVLSCLNHLSLSKKEPMFCPICLPQARKIQDAGRKVFCDALPGCFDLPKWGDLRDAVLE